MNNIDIKVPSGTSIAVVGDIHEHENQFDQIVAKLRPSEKMWLVSAGDVYDKGFGTYVAEVIIDKLKTYHEAGCGFIIRGNHEIKHIKQATRENRMTKQLHWLAKQPLALSFVFDNNTRLTVVHGGVRPSHTWDDLGSDIETSYVRKLDESGEMIKLKWVDQNGRKVIKPAKEGGRPWHEVYDGRFGYIASGHEPQKDGVPKYFNYSCNLDSACYVTGIMSCQIFNSNGLKEGFTVTGPSRQFSEEDD